MVRVQQLCRWAPTHRFLRGQTTGVGYCDVHCCASWIRRTPATRCVTNSHLSIQHCPPILLPVAPRYVPLPFMLCIVPVSLVYLRRINHDHSDLFTFWG